MAIEQRGIKVGSSRLAYGTPARDARMGVPRQTNWVGLAESLGVAVGGVKKDLEEEAKREAISKVHEINVKTAGKSPEERQKAIEDAKAGLGAGRGFFSKLLIDEDKEVKAFDEASWSMRAVDTKREVELMEARMRLEGKSHMEIQEAVTALYNKNLKASKSVSESARASYVKGINDHAHSMLKSMSLKEQKRVYDIKKKQSDDELNKLVYDAIGASGGSTPSDMANVSTIADFEKADNITNANIVGITAEVSKRAQDVYDRATKDFLLDKQEARRSVANLFMKASSLYHNPELYESLMSAPAKGGKSYKEAYPEEYLKNMQVLKSARVKYLAELKSSTDRANKTSNDESFYKLYENSGSVVLNYETNPNSDTLGELESHVKSFEETYEAKKAKGDFRFDKTSQKAYIDHGRYIKSFLKKKAYDREADAKARELLDKGAMTKKEFTLNGHRYSPENRFEAREFIDKTERFSDAEDNELARSNIQYQYSLGQQAVKEAQAEAGRYDIKLLTTSQQAHFKKLKNDLEIYSVTIYRQELHEERKRVAEDPTHKFNGDDVKLRVKDRLEKYTKPIESYFNTQSQVNINNAKTRAEGATVSAPDSEVSSVEKDEEFEKAKPAERQSLTRSKSKRVKDLVQAEGLQGAVQASGATTRGGKLRAVVNTLSAMDMSASELSQFMDSPRGREISPDPNVRADIMGKVLETQGTKIDNLFYNSKRIYNAMKDYYSPKLFTDKPEGTARRKNK